MLCVFQVFEEFDGILLKICHHKIVSTCVQNRKAEAGGVGVGATDLEAKASRGIVILEAG